MSIDLEELQMIVPKKIIPVTPIFKGISVIANHFVKNGVLVKRVEAFGKEAIVFDTNTNEIINKYETDFEIINALFVTFTPKTPEDYLCLIGSKEIDFYALADGMFCPLALPFKISQAHTASFGLILERSSLPGEFGNPPEAAQLYSLTHPYNEILPILCKYKGDSQCHYTFWKRRFGIVPKDIGANWSATYTGQIDLIMCYDYDERTNHIFTLRKCTKEERLTAKSDVGIMNSSALMHTPSAVQSFYSPNFFNRQFAETRLASIGLVNSQQFSQQSPATNQQPLRFTNSASHSDLRPPQINNSITSLMANSSASGIGVHTNSKITPFRRVTRSMTATEKMATMTNTISGASLSTGGPSPFFHRSLEHNATINRMRMKQKLAMCASQGGSSNTNNIFYTPRHGGTSFSAIDMDDLLSFGGKENDDDPPASLDMAVEFCLEWLWSEPLPQEESSTRSGSSSSVGTEKMANKMETLRVSSSASSHSDEAANKGDVSRMASSFFLTKPVFSRNERAIIFHIQSDRRVRVILLALPVNKQLQTPGPPTIMEITANFIRGTSAIPFLHASYFMVLDNFSMTDSLSSASSISLYTGNYKLANISLNIGMAGLLRLLPGGLSSGGNNLFEIRVFAEREHHDAPPNNTTPSDVIEANVFSCQLQLGLCTKLANRCLRAISLWIGSDRQLQFLSRLFCSNPWRIVEAAQQIPFIDELPVECVEMGLLFEQLYTECGYRAEEMPFTRLLERIRSHMDGWLPADEGCSEKKRTRLDLGNANLLANTQHWELLKSDQEIALESMRKLDTMSGAKFVNPRLMATIRRIIREERRIKPPKFTQNLSQTKKPNGSSSAEQQQQHKWRTAPIWTCDLRVHNVQQMLDSTMPILIPSKALANGVTANEVQQREQHEQFLLTVALRTITRPFGRAALNLRTRHGFPPDKGEKDENGAAEPQIEIRPICLNGRVHPGWHQVDFPLNDTLASHKLAMEWASFYNALAHGISFCGGFPAHLFTVTAARDEAALPSTVKAGLLLAAGLTGTVRNAMNLYDIHALLTQNDRYLVIALLIGCAASHRGTSEVHIYKMIATHLPFLLQPTLCEFRIELVIQTAALISLGLLFSETANYTVSSQLLNQMTLEVPCESDQSFERYSLVLAAGMAIGLINLGKGKEITDTEIPISIYPSLKDRLVKALNGDERRLAYLSYDRPHCPGMPAGSSDARGLGCLGCTLLRRYYTTGNAAVNDGITDNANNGGPQNNTIGIQPSFLAIPSRDYSGIGHPSSNHVRELPTLNIHLASPAAAIALGLMYLRTGDKWIRGMLAVKDTFYEIDKNRPDMLMIRTLCQCLVDFDNIRPTKEWVDEQVPEIARKYTKLYLAAKCKEDMWWADVIDVETVAKAYFYCLTGACFAVALRHASTCDQQALRLIHNLYEILEETAANPAPASSSANPSSDHSWVGLASWAGRNCVKACINVCAMSLGLIMAGSGDLQTTRLLRKIRNILPDNTAIPPKDSSVYSLNISVNMALGLLYLGYGRYCFSNSNLAIAALVISLFPLFPHSIADNRFYFQPIRFLWILAVKRNPRPNKLVRKVSLQQPAAQQEENVDCQMCGRTEITNDHKFIFD